MERSIFYSLVQSPNSHKSQGWTILKPDLALQIHVVGSQLLGPSVLPPGALAGS